MNDAILLAIALVIGVLMRLFRRVSGLGLTAMRVAAVLVVAVVWIMMRAVDAPVSIITGLVGAAAAVLILREQKPDKISLRCSGCGNYFPSRDHFASEQLCKTCHAALGGAAQ